MQSASSAQARGKVLLLTTYATGQTCPKIIAQLNNTEDLQATWRRTEDRLDLRKTQGPPQALWSCFVREQEWWLIRRSMSEGEIGPAGPRPRKRIGSDWGRSETESDSRRLKKTSCCTTGNRSATEDRSSSCRRSQDLGRWGRKTGTPGRNRIRKSTNT